MGTQEEKDTMCVGVLHVSSRVGWACHMIECSESYHALRECNFFRSLSAGERTKRVRSLRLCEGCLTFGHSTRARSCPYRKGDDGLCPVRKCGRGHHRLLHDDRGGGSAISQEAEREEEANRTWIASEIHSPIQEKQTPCAWQSMMSRIGQPRGKRNVMASLPPPAGYYTGDANLVQKFKL